MRVTCLEQVTVTSDDCLRRPCQVSPVDLNFLFLWEVAWYGRYTGMMDSAMDTVMHTLFCFFD